jgi:signal transduction histidine kinase
MKTDKDKLRELVIWVVLFGFCLIVTVVMLAGNLKEGFSLIELSEPEVEMDEGSAENNVMEQGDTEDGNIPDSVEDATLEETAGDNVKENSKENTVEVDTTEEVIVEDTTTEEVPDLPSGVVVEE